MTGGTVGQIFYLRANDNLTTVVNSGSLILHGGVNVTMSTNDVTMFLVTSATSAIEIGVLD